MNSPILDLLVPYKPDTFGQDMGLLDNDVSGSVLTPYSTFRVSTPPAPAIMWLLVEIH